ncbi:MAG: hypothetical protein J6Y30_12380 [Treponema sp.]|nr:hypothetical protein [Treponema sp.]
MIFGAFHKDDFLQGDLIAGKKIGAENDNAPTAPTSRKLDIGESLSAYLQADSHFNAKIFLCQQPAIFF